jgi:hypothetical protein
LASNPNAIPQVPVHYGSSIRDLEEFFKSCCDIVDWSQGVFPVDPPDVGTAEAADVNGFVMLPGYSEVFAEFVRLILPKDSALL